MMSALFSWIALLYPEAMLPAPVVSVEDINTGQRRVEVINERATL